MKKYIITITILVFSLLVACDKKENNKINDDLKILFGKVLAVGNQTKSQNGTLSELDFSEINVLVEKIIEENGIEVLENGYYAENYNGTEITEEMLSDIYTILSSISKNGTPAFYEKTLLLCEDNLSLNDVVSDNTLRTTEKIGLTIGLGLSEIGGTSKVADKFDDCIGLYDKAVYACKLNRINGYLYVYSEIGVVFVDRHINLVEEAYTLCVARAHTGFENCMR